MNIDFGRTSSDYARYRHGFPQELFGALRERGLGGPGQCVLDLGAGTGSIALGLAAMGAMVTALDTAAEQLDELRRLAVRRDLEVETVQASAEATGLGSHAFDLLSAGQCWHWFDPVATCAELKRLLAPGGRVVLASFDWLPLPGNVVEATEALILAHNPAWHMGGGDGHHPEWEHDLGAGGFEVLEVVYSDVEAHYPHADWRGRIRASAGVAASLNAKQVAAFDAELTSLLAKSFPMTPMEVPHRLGFCVAR